LLPTRYQVYIPNPAAEIAFKAKDTGYNKHSPIIFPARVMVISEQVGGGQRILLLPNRSASWRQNQLIFIGIASFSLVIAIAWTLVGIWIILPFAGLEIGLLGYFLLKVSASTYQREVLYISSDVVRIEGGKTFPRWRRDFDRGHCEFVIHNPRHSLSPLTIEIRRLADSLRVGIFLNREDADELADWIRRSGVNYRVVGNTRIQALEAFET
jgi:uncharacterized membrane protein